MERGQPAPCLTLLTDYGWTAGFVGALHLVVLSIAPQANVVDLDHSVPAGDVRLGALRFERFARLLPAGVHVGVVDPGVGGSRRPIAIEVGGHHLVGPDNGLLVWAAERLGVPERVVVLDNKRYQLATTASTFDGRDVFVPVAAHLLTDATIDQVGTQIEFGRLVRLERPKLTRERGAAAVVEVIQVDGFGNVQFGANRDDVEALGIRPGDRIAVTPSGGSDSVEASYSATFSDVGPGEPLAFVDSDDQLSLAVNGGRADALFAAPIGSQVRVARIGGRPR